MSAIVPTVSGVEVPSSNSRSLWKLGLGSALTAGAFGLGIYLWYLGSKVEDVWEWNCIGITPTPDGCDALENKQFALQIPAFFLALGSLGVSVVMLNLWTKYFGDQKRASITDEEKLSLLRSLENEKDRTFQILS